MNFVIVQIRSIVFEPIWLRSPEIDVWPANLLAFSTYQLRNCTRHSEPHYRYMSILQIEPSVLGCIDPDRSHERLVGKFLTRSTNSISFFFSSRWPQFENRELLNVCVAIPSKHVRAKKKDKIFFFFQKQAEPAMHQP